MNPTQLDCFQDSVDGRVERALGRPWVALGRDLQGFDCWGFVRYALDLEDAPDAPFFDEKARPGQIKELSKCFIKTSPKTPLSIVLLGAKNSFYHVGIYHPSGTVYHSLERLGVCGHKFGKLGLLGFDSFEFYLWGSHGQASI